MAFHISEIKEITKGAFFNQTQNEAIHHLLTDSRKVHKTENTLFFAIKGPNNDGHQYLGELFQKGVRNFIIESEEFTGSFPQGANIIKVKSSINALQKIALHHRKKFCFPVLGITGSNGKTVVKEWLYQLLREEKNIIRSPKSYNSQVGVPLSLWQIQKQHNMGIIEAGISQPGEMKKLERIIRPDICIITNLNEAHQENFSSKKEKAVEKTVLAKNASTVIYCSDYPQLQNALKKHRDKTVLNWSEKDAGAKLFISSTSPVKNGTLIKGKYREREIELKIPFRDEASLENAIHCWLMMLHLGYSPKVIKNRMKNLFPVAMRLEQKKGINNCTIINDSYNSDLASINIALDFLLQQNQHGKKTLILSDILQSGLSQKKLYRQVAEMLKSKKIDRLIAIGPELHQFEELFPADKVFLPSTNEFFRYFSGNEFSNEAILIKGARPFKFEKISGFLQEKVHETVLEINLNALINNYNYFKSKLRPKTKVMVMVKAFSYGSGTYEIANVLEHHRVDYLAVAYADEGKALRDAGISLPVMVMNPEPASFDMMIKERLEPEIYNFRILERFEKAVRENVFFIENNKPYPVHIKIETGMHRLGFEMQHINKLTARLKELSHLRVNSVFSHLSSTDIPEHDEFTLRQIKDFKTCTEAFMKAFDYRIDRHILNTNGILRFPEAQFDMVRLGIGLYGIAASPSAVKNLETVSKLKSSISQIKTVKKGESIGYGRAAIAAKDMKIAIIPVGYADGLNRALSKGKWKPLIRNKEAPIVGNICMDMTMVDITGIKGAGEGDEVIIFGEKPKVSQMAQALNTIPYEVLTGISNRVRRVFYFE